MFLSMKLIIGNTLSSVNYKKMFLKDSEKLIIVLIISEDMANIK